MIQMSLYLLGYVDYFAILIVAIIVTVIVIKNYDLFTIPVNL